MISVFVTAQFIARCRRFGTHVAQNRKVLTVSSATVLSCRLISGDISATDWPILVKFGTVIQIWRTSSSAITYSLDLAVSEYVVVFPNLKKHLHGQSRELDSCGSRPVPFCTNDTHSDHVNKHGVRECSDDQIFREKWCYKFHGSFCIQTPVADERKYNVLKVISEKRVAPRRIKRVVNYWERTALTCWQWNLGRC